MKKILILQNVIPHYRKPLYNELSRFYEVTVIHSGSRSVESTDLYHEIIIGAKRYGPFVIQSRVLKYVSGNDFDVIISMFDIRWVSNILAMLFCSKSAKFIWWGAWLTNSAVANAIRIYLSKGKYCSIFYTKEAKDQFIEAGVPEEKLFVANNTFHVPDRINCSGSEVKDRILFIGSLNKRKQVNVLLMAFGSIKEHIHSGIKLVIIGDGECLNELKKLARELFLADSVEFYGAINDPLTLQEFYKRAIVSVSYGQAGLGVLQSFAYGVPYITKQNAISGGEKTNIMDGVNGFIHLHNQKGLEGKLLLLCSDLAMAKALGQNAFNYYSEHCTIDNMVEGFRAAIEGAETDNNEPMRSARNA